MAVKLLSFDFEALNNVRQTKEYDVNHDEQSIVFNGQNGPRDLLERELEARKQASPGELITLSFPPDFILVQLDSKET